jgi:hypothetical protein
MFSKETPLAHAGAPSLSDVDYPTGHQPTIHGADRPLIKVGQILDEPRKHLMASPSFSWIFLVCLFSCLICCDAQESPQSFLLIGVSGTLQDGFELRDRLDYKNPLDGATTKAQFVGKALVRGYKAYFDVKRPGWREYKGEPNPPRVPNPVILATGCHNDANIYWMYLVAPEQVLSILAGEPRYLSITPDSGMIDLTAPETSENVKKLALSQIENAGLANVTSFAAPLVTGVWFDVDSFVESPIVYVKEDGTQVTSYDESLAKWAGVEREDLLLELRNGARLELVERKNRAWEEVYKTVRLAEADSSQTRYPKLCQEVRFGVGLDHLRLNYPLAQAELWVADLQDEL